MNCNRGQSGWDSIVSPEKKQEVHQSVVNGPKKSHRKRAQELTLSPSTVWRVMTNNLRLFPYKISTHHVLKEQDKEKCIAICEWFNNKLEQTPSWLNHIHLNGAVNNHITVLSFIPFHPKHGLLRPYWFEEHGKTVTVNSPRYCVIMQRFHDDLSQKLTPGQLRLT